MVASTVLLLSLFAFAPGCSSEGTCYDENRLNEMLKVCTSERNEDQFATRQPNSNANVVAIIGKLEASLQKKCPRQRLLRFSLAACYTANLETGKALKEYEIIARDRPSALFVHQLMGQIYLDKSDFERAIDEFEAEARIDENNTDVLVKVAQIYQQLGRHDESIEAYRKVVSRFENRGDRCVGDQTCYSPSEVKVYRALYKLLSQRGMRREAQQVLKKGIERNPGSVELKRLRAAK
jgi:tetratricopeptide (TPR) repeat protein